MFGEKKKKERNKPGNRKFSDTEWYSHSVLSAKFCVYCMGIAKTADKALSEAEAECEDSVANPSFSRATHWLSISVSHQHSGQLHPELRLENPIKETLLPNVIIF